LSQARAAWQQVGSLGVEGLGVGGMVAPAGLDGSGDGRLCEHRRPMRECMECSGKAAPYPDISNINIKAVLRAAGVPAHCLSKDTYYGSSRELGFCEHNKDRKLCKICRAAALCEHGRERRRCVECGGPGICEHRRIKRQVHRPCALPLHRPPPAAAAPTAGSPLSPFSALPISRLSLVCPLVPCMSTCG